VSEDIRPWGGGSRLGAYFKKRARLHYDRGAVAAVDTPCLRGVVTDNAASVYPMAEPAEMEPVNPSRYIPHKWR
jgi:hypothetical protein